MCCAVKWEIKDTTDASNNSISSQFSLLCLKELLMCSPNIVSLSGFNNFLLPQPQKLPCNGLDLNLGGIKQAETRGAGEWPTWGNILSPPIKDSPQQDKNCCLDPTAITSRRGSGPMDGVFPWMFCSRTSCSFQPLATEPWTHKETLNYCNTQERCCDIFLQMKKLTSFFFG